MRDYQKLLTGVYDDSERRTAITERQMATMYKGALSELSAQVAKLYEKMGDPPSLQEARRYNRLTALKAEIAKVYKQLTRSDIAFTTVNSARSFSDLAYGTEWAIDQATGIELKWNMVPVSAIRSSVMNDATGQDFQERFHNWEVKDQIVFNQSIGTGLALGEPYPVIARRIKKQVQASYDQAIRIVRTEATRNQTLGHLATYEQAEDMGIVMKKQWQATLDERTRTPHGLLDGQFADENGLFHADGGSAEGPGMFGDPGLDINCRCRVVEIIEGLEPELRRIRDEGVVDYITYNDWATAKGWTEEKGWPKEAKV